MALSALSLALAGALPAWAQQSEVPPSLEDLIPDSAVENPADWASDIAGDGTEEQSELEEQDVLSPDSPLEAMPEITVDWPDDLNLPTIEPFEPEEDIRFADSDFPITPLQNSGIVEQVNDQLVLAFPEAVEAFPIREDFVERFKVLSTIEQLADNSDNIAQLRARARADEELLVEMMRVYGYYDAQIIRTVAGAGTSADPDADAGSTDNEGQVRFDILPGQRYRFGMIDLGQLSQAPDAAALRAVFEIQTGDPVSSDKISEETTDLDTAFSEGGYPFAKIGEAELVIDHREAQGDLSVPVVPSGKYTFGSVVSSLPDFLSNEHLGSIARFDAGDTYQLSLQRDLRRAITATGLVSSVSITPRETKAPSGAEPGTVALDVDITQAPLRTVAGAIGYGSEEGVRVQASWEHRNLFPSEGSLKVRGILGTQEQLAGVTFRKNNFRGRDRVLTLDTYASTIDSDAFDARTLAFVTSYERISTLLFQKRISWALGAEVLATDERNRVIGGIPRPRQTFFIGSVSGRIAYDTSDSLLNPTKGFRLSAFAAPEISRTRGSEFFYGRFQADASVYQKVSDTVLIASRARLATIQGGELFGIAPSRRLYAGGGGSVRGYGFQAIGPANDLGEPTGGRSLAEFSLEARVKTGFFGDALSVVPFIDVGAVSINSTPDFRFVKYGAGAGVRYDTGFGPIRVDVGVPLNPGPQDSPVAVYVSLGQAF